ncbi:MAG: hypothetical protein ABI832_24155 [bacterium]
MTKSDWVSVQSPEFDNFLHTSVGEDSNGVRVTVLSALARFGVDPWQEAAKLADLPQADAAERLDMIMLALTEMKFASVDHRALATRLAALLSAASNTSTGARKAVAFIPQKSNVWITVWVVMMAVLFIGQTIVHSPYGAFPNGNASGTSSVKVTSSAGLKP